MSNVLIKNKKTGHEILINKDAWEAGKRFYIGYHLVSGVNESKPIKESPTIEKTDFFTETKPKKKIKKQSE